MATCLQFIDNYAAVSRFYEWVQMVCCHVSYDECNVRQGLAGAWFQLFVSGRLSGYQGQNSPEQAPLPHHWAGRWEDRVCGWLKLSIFSENEIHKMPAIINRFVKQIKVLFSFLPFDVLVSSKFYVECGQPWLSL